MGSVAAELTVYGVVQGVGFRYHCYRRAVDLGLTGWVRNNPDGSVGTYVEGDRGSIEIFIKELKAGARPASVSDVRIQWLEYTGQHRTFEITF